MNNNKKYRIGIIGTGFIGRGLIMALSHYPQFTIGYILTRRSPGDIQPLPVSIDQFTDDIDKLIATSDLVVECSGDVIHGTEMIERVLKANIPVVTMNAELQIVSGTMLARLGKFVEAEGDQPGSLAILNDEVLSMGFKPIVFGNIKRYLNVNPSRTDMEYWAKHQGITMQQVTAFTDGTKLQIEQALVANALDATIACRNLSGIDCVNVEDGARLLGEIAEGLNRPISDYVLCPTGPAGVFIVATHDAEQVPYLEYLKLGAGPHYVITQPFHLCHLEIPKTILRILMGTNHYSFNNGQKPMIQVVAVAKRAISVGEHIKRGLGSFDARGEAVKIKDCPGAVPIGLLSDATFLKSVAEGQTITFTDVSLPESRALTMWRQILDEYGFNAKT